MPFPWSTNVTEGFPFIVDPATSPCERREFVAMKTITAVVCSLVCLLGVTGNLLVIAVLLHNRLSISSTDVYLLHLATADLLFALTLPFWAVDTVSGWVFGDAMCKVIGMLQEVNFYSGILLLACISVDRYLAIVRSAQLHGHKRPWLVKLLCATVWLVALLLSLPVLYNEVLYDYEFDRSVCNEEHDGDFGKSWKLGIKVSRLVIGFLMPLAAMVFCYTVTVWKLCQTKGFQKQKAMKVIIAVVLAFLACWLPYHLTLVVDMLVRVEHIKVSCIERDHLDRAVLATQCLAFLHSCINPILYAFIGVKFRRNLVKLLAHKGLIKRSEETQFKQSRSSSVSGQTSTTI